MDHRGQEPSQVDDSGQELHHYASIIRRKRKTETPFTSQNLDSFTILLAQTATRPSQKSLFPFFSHRPGMGQSACARACDTGRYFSCYHLTCNEFMRRWQ